MEKKKRADRIEVYERYITNKTEIDYLKEQGIDSWVDRIEYSYRRTNPLWVDIERPIEIEGNDEECKIRFYNGYSITIRCNYDEFCIMLNDYENGKTSDLF